MKNLFGALANSGRLRMMRILLRGPLNVSEISDILGLSQSNVSHSLRVLLDANLVLRKGKGSWAYYSLNRQDPVAGMLIEVVSSGVRKIENYDNDMSELRLCYDRRRKEAREFFDRVAAELDEVSYLMPSPDGYIDAVLDGFPRGGVVLDAGCGSGDMVLRILRSGMSVIGVDQSQEMLSQAGKKIGSDWGGNSVELRLGSAEHLPVADSSVDGILAHMLLHHLSEPSEFFTEAARVCREGGRCSVVELAPHEASDLKRMQGDLWPGLDRGEVRDWMVSAGFVDIHEIAAGDGRVFILSGLLKGRNGNG
ncbi:MAG: ArsR family transcriptional regulator [Candidatus Fermentibacteraceae bacterium]|nr:ArsR family transcriptional regulator [Candidatus Fermentibacteraceae bacterium]